MPRRFDLGRVMLAAGGLLLFVSLFLDWYDTGQTGWEVFETIDLVLTALALAALYASLRLDVIYDWVPGAIAVTTMVVVAVQLIEPPPAAAGADPRVGGWLALGAGALMAAGAALALARFSITVEMRDRDRRHRVAAVDRRAAGVESDPAPGGREDDLGRTETFTALREDEEPGTT